MAILLRRVCSHDTGQYIRLVYNKISEEISFKGKSLFYVIILGCSVLCHIAHFCGLVVRENIMVGKAWWNKAVHIMTSRKQRQREWMGQNHIYFPRIMPSSIHFLQINPISYASVPSQQSIKLWTHQLIHSKTRAPFLWSSYFLSLPFWMLNWWLAL